MSNNILWYTVAFVSTSKFKWWVEVYILRSYFDEHIGIKYIVLLYKDITLAVDALFSPENVW